MKNFVKAVTQAMKPLVSAGGVLAVALMAGIGPASAAAGDPVAVFDATSVGVPVCPANQAGDRFGTGVAHDGTNLILSCWGSNLLERVKVSPPVNVGPLAVSGLAAPISLGALDWDPGRQKLWACNNDTQVVLIDMTTGIATVEFSVVGCTEGLVYDASDDSLWVTNRKAVPDSWFVYHYKANGDSLAQIDTDDLDSQYDYPPGGLALQCGQMYLAGDENAGIFSTNKTFAPASLFFTPTSPLPGDSALMSDLAVDRVSFSPKTVLWVVDRKSRLVYAAELPDCNRPPVCTAAAADPADLWPPNHKYVKIGIKGVVDPDGDLVTITATSVRQDEIVKGNGLGSGNTDPDATLIPLAVRAERNGNPKTPGNGRVYHIGFTASDGNGGTCTGVAKVCVPHDQRPTGVCIDGGPLYDSLKP